MELQLDGVRNFTGSAHLGECVSPSSCPLARSMVLSWHRSRCHVRTRYSPASLKPSAAVCELRECSGPLLIQNWDYKPTFGLEQNLTWAGISGRGRQKPFPENVLFLVQKRDVPVYFEAQYKTFHTHKAENGHQSAGYWKKWPQNKILGVIMPLAPSPSLRLCWCESWNWYGSECVGLHSAHHTCAAGAAVDYNGATCRRPQSG